MKKIIKKFSSLALIAFAAAFIVVSLPINQVAAADYIYGNSQKPNGVDSTDISAIHEDLDIEARAQLLWHILYKCVKGSYEERDSDFNPSEISSDDDFFDYSRDVRGVVTVPTGYWLENQVQGNGGDDGAIYCRQGNNKILFLAADVMNEALSKHGESFSYEEILCDGTDDGIIHYRKGSHKCNPHHDTDNYEFASGWNSHLKKLWEHGKEVAGWAKDWSNIGMYQAANGRILYEREAGTRCGSKASVSGGNALGYAETPDQKPGGYYFDPALQIIGQDGGDAYEYFTENNEIENEFVDRDDIDDCVDLITRANTDTVVDNFRAKVYVTFNDRCRNFYQNIVDTDDKVTDDTKSQFNDLKSADDAARAGMSQNTGLDKSVYKFLQDKNDPNDSSDTMDMECIDIEGLLHPEQSEDQSYADDAEDDLDATKTDPDCYTNAGSLGWILCPIINQGGEFVTMIYEKMIEPFLVLDSGLFNRGEVGGNATYDAWTQFQTYANIAFIAVFLIVIFSQLTGYGIDNYGIKKILPKLIVSALMINLSYIICQLAVDIANIMGYGMKSILANIGQVNIGSMSTAEAPTAHPAMATGATAILVGLVALLVVPAILSKGTAILVPVFIAIISIVIAVFTLFCILAIRKAFAVILVVISPMAFLCYMLPNTKKLFDKWFTAFKAVLIAFPICSAMVYGGQAVARILVQASGGTNMPFLMVLSAAVMSIAPVFLIPGTLKKSMGAISGFINGASSRLNHAAKGRAMESRGARYLQKQGEQRMMARQGEYNRKKASRALYQGSLAGRALQKATGGKYQAGLANKKNLSATQRRAYNAALGALSAEDKNQIDTHTSRFKALGSDSEIRRQIEAAAKDGSLDSNMMAAALSAVHDENHVADIMAAADHNGAMAKMIKGNDPNSVSNRQKIAGALGGRSGNIIAQSMGKLVNDGETYADMMGGSLAKKVQSAGTSVMANQDKDVFETLGAGDMFSSEQLAAGVSAGYSGSTADKFNNMLSGLSSAKKNAVIGEMKSGDQWSKSSSDSLAALGGTAAINSVAGSNADVQNAINTLATNEDLHAQTDAGVLNAVGIKSGQKIVDTGQYVNRSGGAEQTIVQKSDGKFYRVTGSGSSITETEVDIRNFKRKK